MAKQSKVVKWKIDDLHPHPRQSELFHDLSEIELAFLADDIKLNGLQQPIEILPDGTVVAGHQRLRAARMLEWNEIAVDVRDDLEAAGPGAILARMIETNLNRRQLGPLAIARCVKELVELEHPSDWKRRQDMLLEIGQRLNLSVRSVNRYLAVLESPRAVQEALEHGQLTIVLASQVARLPPDVQEQAASRISAGEKPRSVAKELVDAYGTKRFDDSPAFGPLISRLTDLVKMIPGPTDEVGNLNSESTVELLEQLVTSLSALKRRVKANLRRGSQPESEPDRETEAELVFDAVRRAEGEWGYHDEPTTSVESPAKTSKRRAKKR